MFSNIYIYTKNGDMVRLTSGDRKDEFWFKDGKIYKNSTESSIDELTDSIKSHLKFYKEKAEHIASYIDKTEVLFEDSGKSRKFLSEYNHRKYNLKKFQSSIIQFETALENLSIEQACLKKQLKIYIYESRILNENIRNLLTRLDDVNEYIESIKRDKMTKSLYTLTFVSTIFLPLNLITGFFGMNTGGMFLSKGEFGTFYVLVLICVVVMVLLSVKKFADID